MCGRIVVLEWTLENPLDCKEIKPGSPKEIQPWIFIGRTDAKSTLLWPSDAKSWLFGKDPNAGKDWGQEEKGMVGWHHWLNGHESEQTLRESEGQGGLVCCSSWGAKSWTWQWLNNNKMLISVHLPESLNSLYQNSGIIYCKMILTACFIFWNLGSVVAYTCKMYTGVKTVSSISGAGKTEQIYVKEWN